jgi:hypothetical protein
MNESYWMPKANGIVQQLGAVKGYEGMKLNRDAYLSLLESRLKELINRDDPEQNPWDIDQVIADLEAVDLVVEPVDRDEELDSENLPSLILDTQSVRTRLYELGVTSHLPARFPSNDPKAEQMYKEVDFGAWVTALTLTPLWEHPER